jgi:hypothetical protein
MSAPASFPFGTIIAEINWLKAENLSKMAG